MNQDDLCMMNQILELKKKQLDISSVENAPDMIRYYVPKKEIVARLLKIVPAGKKLLVFAENTTADYQIFKKKKIPKHDLKLQKSINSSNAVFEILVVLLRLQQKLLLIDDVDYKKLKLNIVEAHQIDFGLQSLFLIQKQLANFFLEKKHFKIGRVFFMLCINITKLINAQLSKILVPDKLLKMYKMNEVHRQLTFLSFILIRSCSMMKKDSTWTETQSAREHFFDDLLQIMSIKDVWPEIPKMIQSSKQCQTTSDIMLLKVGEYEQVYQDYMISYEEEPKNHPHIFIPYWRGLIFNTLQDFQKETVLKLKLTQKSIEYWELLFHNSFSMTQLKALVPVKDDYLLRKYLVTLFAHSGNYEKLIGAKRYVLMKMNSDDLEVKSLIGELNLLRSNYIIHEKRFMIFPKLFPNSKRMKCELYENIGFQYRSIVNNSKKGQLENLKSSEQFLLKFHKEKSAKLFLSGEEDPFLEKTDQEIITLVGQKIDSDEFIQKFRIF